MCVRVCVRARPYTCQQLKPTNSKDKTDDVTLRAKSMSRHCNQITCNTLGLVQDNVIYSRRLPWAT